MALGIFYIHVRAWKLSHTLVSRSRLQRSLREARDLGLGYYAAAAQPHRLPLGQRRFLFRHPFSKDLPRSLCHRWVFICYDVDMIHGSSSVVVGTCFEQAVEAAVAGSGTPATTKPRRTNGGSGGEVLLFAS